MASKSVQKARQNGSPLGVSRPIKATLPFVLASPSSAKLVGGASPPTSLTGLGVDAQSQVNIRPKKISPDRSQNGSPIGFRVLHSADRKSTLQGNNIKRSGSFEVIASNSYLSGEWPRTDPLVTQAYFCPSTLTSDKFTQTPEEWCKIVSPGRYGKHGTMKRSSSAGNGDSLKDIKARLAKTSKEAGRLIVSGPQRSNPLSAGHHGYLASTSSKAISIPSSNRHRRSPNQTHGSQEALNQEIEKLVLNRIATGFDDDSWKHSTDGRRAPLARQLKTCSVLTQTPPATSSLGDMEPAHGKLGDMEPSYGKLVDDLLDDAHTTRPSSRDESDFKTDSASPKLTDFIMDRLPPDGCEKVQGKFQENGKDKVPSEQVLFLKPPTVVCAMIPSEKSAFNPPPAPPPLVKNYLEQPSEMAAFKRIGSASSIQLGTECM